MANPLQSLLGMSQVVSAAPDPLAVPEGDEIVVDGNRNDPYRLENPSDVSARDIGIQAGEEASDHKGMFGVKGTLRDVLGLVGDAFLIQSGNDPIYTPHRRQERMSDAMAGFTGDPLAAIERVAAHNPEAAQKMHEAYLTNQYREGQNATAGLRAQTGAADLRRKGMEGARTEASQAIAGALAVGTPEAIAYAQKIAEQAGSAYGFAPEELGLPAGPMTEEQARVLAGRSATTNQNLSLPIAQQRADTGTGNLRERQRTNRVRERQADDRNKETRRANRAREADRDESNEISRQRALNQGGSGGGKRNLRGSNGSSLRIRPVG